MLLRRGMPALSGMGRRALALQRFPVPEMGDSITEGTLLEFAKQVGDVVGMEEMIASVETDKVTVEVRAPAAGTITQLFANVNDTVIVGGDFMEIDVGVGEVAAAATAAAPPAAAASSDAPTPSAAAAATAPAGARRHPSGKASLISFPPRGARALRAATPAPMPKAASAPAPKPAEAAKKRTAVAGHFSIARLPMSEEEMEAVMSGGASTY